MRISLNKILLWRWIAALRAEKDQLGVRVGLLETALRKVRLPPMLITTMPKSGTYYISKLFTQGLFIDSRITSCGKY